MIAEYAKLIGRDIDSVRHKCNRGGFKTAEKRGIYWFISKDKPYSDNRRKENKGK